MLDAKVLSKIAYLAHLKLHDVSLLKSLERVLTIAANLPQATSKRTVDSLYLFKAQPIISFSKKLFWKNIPTMRDGFIEVNAVFNDN